MSTQTQWPLQSTASINRKKAKAGNWGPVPPSCPAQGPQLPWRLSCSSIPHRNDVIWCLSFSVWLIHSIWQSLCLSILLQMALFHSYFWQSNILLYTVFKKWSKWTYLQNINGVTDVENKVMFSRGERRRDTFGNWDEHIHTCKRWRRQWHPTPVLLPGKSHGWRSLVGYSPWVARSRTWLSEFTFTFHFHALEKEIATHSSVLAWRIPEAGEPVGLPSVGLHSVGHDWSDLAAAAAAYVREITIKDLLYSIGNSIISLMTYMGK